VSASINGLSRAAHQSRSGSPTGHPLVVHYCRWRLESPERSTRGCPKREVLSRVDQRSPHQREATAEARTSFGQSCARVARRLPRGRPRADPARRDRPLSRRRRLRRERAHPCEQPPPLVQQPAQQPRPQASSPLARPGPQRTVGVSHLPHRVHHEQTREFERWHHADDHLPEPPFRTRPGPAQHNLLPTPRPRGDRAHSATAAKACEQLPIPPAP